MNTKQKLKKINANFELWARNFVKIIDNEGKEIPFIFNAQQKDFIKNMDKFNCVLKSRQIGFSTLALAYSLWLVCTRANTTCLLVSYNLETTQALFGNLKQMYAGIPDRYKPKELKNNKYELKLDNNSKVLVKTAGNKSLGRGLTCQYIHLSEYAFYPDVQQKEGLVALEQALAKNNDSAMVIETTANGYNYFQNLFTDAQKGYSKWKAFFYPWYCEATQKQFKHEINLAEQWFKENHKGDRLRPKTLERDEEPLYEKGISLKMIMWRRWKLTSMAVEDFNQEFPDEPLNAFKTTARTVFDIAKVTSRINYLLPILNRHDIKIKLPESLDRYYGKGFFMFKNVKQGQKYYAGVDTASGSGGDYSTVSVFDSEGVQVAVFFDNKIPVYRFAKVINDLGRYYNYSFLVVERNSYGLGVIERLRREYGYLNMYKQKMFDEYGKRKLQLGYFTSKVNKAKLINDFKEQFELDLILMNDSNTLEQMKIFQDVDGKMGNIRGANNYDDLVIASALAVQGMKCGKWYI